MPQPDFKVTVPAGTVAPHATPAKLARLMPGWVSRYKKVTVQANAPMTAPAPSTKTQPPAHQPLTLAQGIVTYSHLALTFAGRMVYDESSKRSQLFHRKPGDFAGAHADCSQFGATILHWLGVGKVTDTDFTGTLLEKFPIVKTPAAGRGAIWGPGSGAHFAFVTEKTEDGKDWYVVGFGHQGAPNRSTLSGMNAYFASIGQHGVRYLEFAG